MSDKITDLLSRGAASGFDPERLLGKIIHNFGGEDGFAQAIATEFNEGASGGLSRQRILEMISRLFTYVHESKPQGDPLDGLEAEDIEAQLKKLAHVAVEGRPPA
jgi:hypothetical protein